MSFSTSEATVDKLSLILLIKTHWFYNNYFSRDLNDLLLYTVFGTTQINVIFKLVIL